MKRNIAETKSSVDTLIDRARDAALDVTDHAERGVESAADKVVEGAHAAGEYVRDGARTASRSARRGVKRAAKFADRGYNRARSELSRATTATTDYATEHPRTLLVLAAAAGLMLGLLLHRRCKSD